MEYVKVKDGKIIKFVPRPDWRDDNGNPVSDDILIKEGYFPVDYETNKPEYDTFYQKIRPKHGFQDWEITKDRVIVAYEIIEKTLDEKKEELKRKVKEWFIEKLRTGKVNSSLGFTSDARRYAEYNDKDNLKSLIDLGKYPILWKDADGNDQKLSESDAKILLQEMIEYGLSLYQQKWQKEAQINACNSMEELKQVAENLKLI